MDFAQWFWRVRVRHRVGEAAVGESLISELERKPWLVNQIFGVDTLFLLELAVLWWWRYAWWVGGWLRDNVEVTPYWGFREVVRGAGLDHRLQRMSALLGAVGSRSDLIRNNQVSSWILILMVCTNRLTR